MVDKKKTPTPRGWPLLTVPDEKGELHFLSFEETVRRSIEIILQTRPGEQLMRPEFGAGLTNFLHEPNNLTTRRRIRDAVTESLTRWEKRIELDRVEVWEVPERTSHVRVEIGYHLRRNGTSGQVALTMQLEG